MSLCYPNLKSGQFALKQLLERQSSDHLFNRGVLNSTQRRNVRMEVSAISGILHSLDLGATSERAPWPAFAWFSGCASGLRNTSPQNINYSAPPLRVYPTVQYLHICTIPTCVLPGFHAPDLTHILPTACKIRAAAVCALTRRELATDEIAAHACGLLGDENPCLRQKVLRRLGSLMKENR